MLRKRLIGNQGNIGPPEFSAAQASYQQGLDNIPLCKQEGQAEQGKERACPSGESRINVECVHEDGEKKQRHPGYANGADLSSEREELGWDIQGPCLQQGNEEG